MCFALTTYVTQFGTPDILPSSRTQAGYLALNPADLYGSILAMVQTAYSELETSYQYQDSTCSFMSITDFDAVQNQTLERAMHRALDAGPAKRDAGSEMQAAAAERDLFQSANGYTQLIRCKIIDWS